MNKCFSFRRLWLVGRWDLCVNRQFYLKMAAIMFAAQAIAVLFAHTFNLRGVREATICVWLGFQYIGMTVAFFGHMFHNLRSRQSRIGELMLPATTAERFVWHVGFMVVALHVLFFGCMLLLEPLNFLIARLFSDEPSKSIFLTLLDVSEDSMKVGINYELENQLAGWIFASSFALGNAWKYRYNIGLTAFCYVLMLLAYSFVDNAFRNAYYAGRNLSYSTWLEIVLFVCIWVLTYRLFKRAQYITRRNP